MHTGNLVEKVGNPLAVGVHSWTLVLHRHLVRGTGIESVTACETARTLSPNLLAPNLCGALDTVHGLPSGGCGDSSTEREFPSDKVYRHDDRGIVGVESLIF